MTEILEIASKVRSEKTNLCTRCLGRLFGKLGHGLDNPTRGKVVQLMLILRDKLSSSPSKTKKRSPPGPINAQDFTELLAMIDNFEFDNTSMTAVTEVLDIDYNPSPQTVDPANNRTEPRTNKLATQILSLVEPTIIDTINTEKPGAVNTAADIECSICRNLFDELPRYADLVCEAVKNYEFNDFLIGSKFDIDQTTHEEELWSKLGATHPEPMKAEFNRELGKLVGARLGIMVNFDTPEMTVILDTRYDSTRLQVASLFIYGRYRKHVRDLPQTKWPCKVCWGKGCKKCNGTGKIYPSSVEEQIAEKVMDASKGKTHLFHGMGREDIGVRMLGRGRPFILEITDPVHRALDLQQLQETINKHTAGKVEVSALRFTNHRAVRELKAAKPSKQYRVNVEFETKVDLENLKEVISTLSGTTIEQRTPVRVSHRRADLVRKRKVIDMELTELQAGGKVAELTITGESGLYIKELITGDTGRTAPSLASELSMECTVQELDVSQIFDE